MLQWRQLLFLTAMLSLALVSHAASVAGKFSSDLDSDHYDCIVSLTPSPTLAETRAVHVILEWGVDKAYSEIVISKQRITLLAQAKGKATTIGQVPSGVVPGSPYELTIVRRGTTIGLMHGATLIYRGAMPRPKGADAGITADKGWSVTDTRIQRLEPVVFADDFMRSEEENGPWAVQSGKWALQSAWDKIPHGNSKRFANTVFSQNPFAWIGMSDQGQPAVCTTGNAFWEDYTMTLALNPGADGAAGVFFNMTDEKNDLADEKKGLLVRWTPANASGADGNKLTLYQIVNNTRTEIKSDAGGFVPGQWYKLSIVSSLAGVQVAIDGRTRLVADNVTPWRGSVGLYAEGDDGAVFDDVTVYGHSLNTDLLLETKQTQVGQRFMDDDNGMKEWAQSQQGGWLYTSGTVPNFRWYQSDLYGDHQWMSLTVTPIPDTVGELWMTLNGDATNCTSGYRAVIKIATKRKKLQFTYTIYRNAAVMASTTAPVPTDNQEYTVRFWRVGTHLSLEIDGDQVLEATETGESLRTSRPAYRTDGMAFIRVHDVQVFSQSASDYTFADSPTDWETIGTWMPSIRWSCAPTWSFLSGWSRGEAALWYKKRLQGDQTMEAFMGVKMEYPREREIYFRRPGYFAVTICGDGQHARTGYSGIYGEQDEQGNPCARAVILRNGVVVASMPIQQKDWSVTHRHWFDLRLSKQGEKVLFNITMDKEYYTLSYSDPQPIDSGVPAIWTFDNGISVARAHVECANTMEPRTDPQVVIDTPWYPEWLDQGKTLSLDFAHCWSTTGKPVEQFAISAVGVPTGDEKAALMNGHRLIFTPQQTGQHWYTLVASDGVNTSPAFHLSLPVFNASVGRDDSHALVLYRFTEGNGDVVHDESKIAPAADLLLPTEPNSSEWIPGQGLKMHGQSALISKDTVDKLQAIARARACTLEFWVSTDTLFPPTGWTGSLLDWQSTTSAVPNVSVGQNRENFVVNTRSTGNSLDGNVAFLPGFRTGLRHLVVTWDGSMTRTYLDGTQIGKREMPWGSDQWVAAAKLYLGNYPDRQRAYLGTFYLVAIHDRCFTDAEVKRNYDAGPSAR